MRNVFLVSYKVKGIKALDRMVSLSFYKKTITMPIDIQEYNIKGIYGMNGSGKSGIIASADILKNLLMDENYLNNPMAQKNLDAIINKKTEELSIEAEFLVEAEEKAVLYSYEVALKKNRSGRYAISMERLSFKPAASKRKDFIPLVEVREGKIFWMSIYRDSVYKDRFTQETTNLLSNATVSALFVQKLFIKKPHCLDEIKDRDEKFFFYSFIALFVFGSSIHVYMDQSDDHTDYLLSDLLNYPSESDHGDSYTDFVLRSAAEMDRGLLNLFSAGEHYVPKEAYEDYVKAVRKLQGFIQIFKSDLIRIDIDRKEDREGYVCSLIMVYDSYSINTEFESTGIKKLIKLFAYLRKMVQGDIVFIDEFDSNLHDVYLCALLEYLMDYGKGQLCFTTHNVGSMDVLKRHKKSIDFLSVDRQIYPWTKNGNYSPSKLYKNGMIEGSPFNVDSIDFIGVFDRLDEEE
ncbi:MAG: AAA family ATPase [Peptostreptococcaceae bacterium]|nr:AAA family ATPase [Peptostreptococcaceae bacterium]